MTNKSKFYENYEQIVTGNEDSGFKYLSYILNHEIHDLAIARSSSSCAVPALSGGI